MQKIIILFCILCFSICLSANSFASNYPKSREDLAVYRQSIKLCADPSLLDPFKVFGKSAKETLIGFQILKANSELQSLLDNYWFHVALEDCYPGNMTKKLWFIGSLISADIAGKAAGGIGLVTAFKFAAKAMLALKKFSAFGYYSVQTTVLASGIYKAYSQYRLAQEKSQKLINEDPHYKMALEDYRLGKITKEDIDQAYVKYSNKTLNETLDQFDLILLNEINARVQTLKKQLSLASTHEEQVKIQKSIDELNSLKQRLL